MASNYEEFAVAGLIHQIYEQAYPLMKREELIALLMIVIRIANGEVSVNHYNHLKLYVLSYLSRLPSLSILVIMYASWNFSPRSLRHCLLDKDLCTFPVCRACKQGILPIAQTTPGLNNSHCVRQAFNEIKLKLEIIHHVIHVG